MNAYTPPRIKLKGPVINMPSRGPWLACGLKIIGPKNPAQKPIEPNTIAPSKMLVIIPFGAEPIFFEVYHAAVTAANREMRLGIQRCSVNGNRENGTQ